MNVITCSNGTEVDCLTPGPPCGLMLGDIKGANPMIGERTPPGAAMTDVVDMLPIKKNVFV